MTVERHALAVSKGSGASVGRRPILLGCVLLGLGGCAFAPEQGMHAGDDAEAIRTEAASVGPKTRAPSAAMAASRRDASSSETKTETASAAEEPIAVIELPPMTETLSPEMETRLREVAEAAKADERITLLLEGFVPDGGSPALNVGLAEQSLAVVRKRLLAMRVPVSRIQIIPFGEHHNRARSHRNHWVEIYYRIRDR